MNCALSAALLVAVLGTSPVFTAQAHTQAPWDAPGVQQTHGAVRLRGERTNWRTMRVRQRLVHTVRAAIAATGRPWTELPRGRADLAILSQWAVGPAPRGES